MREWQFGRVVRPCSFDPSIEYYRVLFFTLKLSNPVKNKHVIGYASGKIDMRGDIMETGCHSGIAVLFGSLER